MILVGPRQDAVVTRSIFQKSRTPIGIKINILTGVDTDLMPVVNLTPHDISIIGKDGEVRSTFPASGEVLRLSTIDLGTQAYPEVDAPVELVEFGHLLNPPRKLPGVWYLVSLPCALAHPRGDFLVPYLEVRDDSGRIIGCRLLGRPV